MPRTKPRRASLIARYRKTDLDAVLAEVAALLGRDRRDGPGQDARPVDGHHAERLADLSDPRLPRLGALGLLPGQRRLRLPRPAAGLHGAGRGPPGDDARPPAARRRPAVRRGRRPALVAAALRPGRAHAHLGRPRLARLCRRALRRRHRRRRRARRGSALPRRPGAGAGRERQLLPADRRRTRPPACTSIAPAPSTPAWRSAATACR